MYPPSDKHLTWPILSLSPILSFIFFNNKSNYLFSTSFYYIILNFNFILVTISLLKRQSIFLTFCPSFVHILQSAPTQTKRRKTFPSLSDIFGEHTLDDICYLTSLSLFYPYRTKHPPYHRTHCYAWDKVIVEDIECKRKKWQLPSPLTCPLTGQVNHLNPFISVGLAYPNPILVGQKRVGQAHLTPLIVWRIQQWSSSQPNVFTHIRLFLNLIIYDKYLLLLHLHFILLRSTKA